MNKKELINLMLHFPYKVGHLLGFTKLTQLHNKWLIDMIRTTDNKTLQAHRSSYKTTCISIALFVLLILFPNLRILFMRKTDTDVREIVEQVSKMLKSDIGKLFSKTIWGVEVKLIKDTGNEINTNLTTDPRGASQLTAIGIDSSLTGKHYDIIFTDDIVNLKDRESKAERDKTKRVYQELHNLVNEDGHIFNTGTPWHKEDCFSIMPKADKYDCYTTGLMTAERIQEKKDSMTSSLFAANYELKHIATDDIIFTDPQIEEDPAKVEQGIGHIDAAYGGEDFTAFTECKKKGKDYYIYGRLWHKHIDDVLDEIISLHKGFNGGIIYCEKNADKGYLAKEIKTRGQRAVTYHENMNKYVKITSYLKGEWKNVYFVAGTDPEYIEQICDYNENAEHDDAPDSCASAVRKLWKKKNTNDSYNPIFL